MTYKVRRSFCALIALAASCMTGGSCGGGSSPGSGSSSPLGILIGADLSSPNNVPVLSILADGSLVVVPGSPFQADGPPEVVTASASSHMVFVACDTGNLSGEISVFQISSNGDLNSLGPPMTSNVIVPLSLSLTPLGNFLLVGNGNFSPVIFQVDTVGGALSYVGNLGATGPVAFSPDGKFIFFVNGSYLDSYAFDSTTGAAVFASSSFQFFGTVPNPPVAHPSGQFVYVPYSHQNGGVLGGIAAFSVAPDGTLSLLPGSPFAVGTDFGSQAGSWSKSAVIDKTGTHLYVIGAGGADAFDINQTSGALMPTSGASPFATGGYSLAMEPSGQYLFLSQASGISSYAVGSGVPKQVHGPIKVGNEVTSIVAIQP